ncbi:MAG: ribonuclease III [Alphaproteobacteria bacterium]|nr:ribonuclease III [Alphaproteobacteria bacterium]
MDASSIGLAEARALGKSLGHVFRDAALLARALTHASASVEASNERLEFLGDRVLGLIVAERLHALYPGDAEGALALKFNAIAKRDTCAKAAESAGLSEHLILAASEAGSGGRKKLAILAGVCEAVIAAIYLDGGMDAARVFVDRYFADAFANLNADMRDAKTALQEWSQGRKGAGRAAPVYRLVTREGPDHAPHFRVEVSVHGEEPVLGEGSSKREAEQAAARAMMDKLGLMKA